MVHMLFSFSKTLNVTSFLLSFIQRNLFYISAHSSSANLYVPCLFKYSQCSPHFFIPRKALQCVTHSTAATTSKSFMAQSFKYANFGWDKKVSAKEEREKRFLKSSCSSVFSLNGPDSYLTSCVFLPHGKVTISVPTALQWLSLFPFSSHFYNTPFIASF